MYKGPGSHFRDFFFFCSECRKDNQTCFHCVLISVEMFKSISSQRRDTDIYWKPTLFYFSGACLFSSKTSRTVNKCRAQSQTCMVSIKWKNRRFWNRLMALILMATITNTFQYIKSIFNTLNVLFFAFKDMHDINNFKL